MTRYYIAKCANAEGLTAAVEEGVWGIPERKTPPQPRQILSEAAQQGPVCLIASVTGTKYWSAYGFLEGTCRSIYHGTCTRCDLTDCQVPEPVGLFLLGGIDKAKAAEQAAAEAQVPQDHFFLADGDSVDSWQPFLAEVAKFGRVLYAANIGSRAFNLNLPDSDYDMIAIVACPTGDLLRLRPPPHTVRNHDNFKPDFTVHEVAYFLQLLVGGDPRMIELLFQEESTAVFISEEWRSLRPLAQRFLTKAMVRKYCSEIDGPKGVRLVKDSTLEPAVQFKKYYILFRLLNSARLAMTEDFRVYLPAEHPARQRIMAIRAGQLAPAVLLEQFEREYQDLLQSLASWAGPESCGVLPELLTWLGAIRNVAPSEHMHLKILDEPPVFVENPSITLDPLSPKPKAPGQELAPFCHKLADGDPKLVAAVFYMSPETPHFRALVAAREELLSPRFLKKILRSLQFSLKDGCSLPDQERFAELLHHGARRYGLTAAPWSYSLPGLAELCATFEGFDYNEAAQVALLQLLDQWQLSLRLSLYPALAGLL